MDHVQPHLVQKNSKQPTICVKVVSYLSPPRDTIRLARVDRDLFESTDFKMSAVIDLTLTSENERSPLQSKTSGAFVLRNGNAGGLEICEESRPRKRQKQSKPTHTKENGSEVTSTRMEHPGQMSKHSAPLEVIDLEAVNSGSDTPKYGGMPNGHATSYIGVRSALPSDFSRTSIDVLERKQNGKTSRPVHIAEPGPNGHIHSQIGRRASVPSDSTRTSAPSSVLGLNQSGKTSRPVHSTEQVPNGHRRFEMGGRASALSDLRQTFPTSMKQNGKPSKLVHSADRQGGVYASKNARNPNLSSSQMKVVRGELATSKEQQDRLAGRREDATKHNIFASRSALDDMAEDSLLKQAQPMNADTPRDGKVRKDTSTLINGKAKGRGDHGSDNLDEPQSHQLEDKSTKMSLADSQPRHKHTLHTNLTHSRENLAKEIQSRSQAKASPSSSKIFKETNVKSPQRPRPTTEEMRNEPRLVAENDTQKTARTSPVQDHGGRIESQIELRSAQTHEPATPSKISNKTAGLESGASQDMTPLSWEAIETVLWKHIKELQNDQDYFTKTWLARARRCFELKPNLEVIPSVPEVPTVPQAFLQTQSPFIEMKADQVLRGKRPEVGSSELIHSQDLWGASKTKSTRTTASSITTSYASEAVDVPPFNSYIDLESNVLAENDQRLLYWPYFDDEEDRGRLEDELRDKYVLLADQRPRIILRNEKARKLESYTKRFLAEIGCNLNDVLRCLLDPSPKIDVGLASNALRAWLARDKHFDEDVDRTSEKWSMVYLTKLHPSSDRALAVASLACAVFYKVCGFGLWHIAKKSLHVKTEITTLSSQANWQAPSTFRYASIACRVCQVHDCTHHGEFREGLDPNKSLFNPDRDDLSAVDVSDSDDGDRINHRAHVNACSTSYNLSGITSENVVYRGQHNIRALIGMDCDGKVEGRYNSGGSPSDTYLLDNMLCSEKCFWKKSNRTGSISEAWSTADIALLENVYPACATDRRGPCIIASMMNKPCVEIFYAMVALADKIFATNPSTARRSALPAKRSATYWLQNSDTQLITQRAPFYPCKHSGSCKSAQCRCFRENVTCEKTCACSADCNRRFRGCKCAQVGQICFQSQGCACFTLNRECDADLCGTCGAAEVLDPENRYNTEIGKAKCTNVYMQKNMPKRTLLGHSEVHGFGLFMGEPVKAHDYLGEYKGETLTKGESDRRSTIYQYQRTSYTFDLNKDQEIDSTRCGNKFRFINNSEVDATINCYPKITLCNTVTRIGMFAKRDIEIGEELFFNYGYPKSVTSKFWERSETRQDRAARTAQLPEKPLIGRKSDTSKGVPSRRPRMSNPTTNPADAAVKVQPESNGKGGVASTVSTLEPNRGRELPSRRVRSLYAARAATDMHAGGALVANLGVPRDDQDLRSIFGTEVGGPLEFVDDEEDEDYEVGEEGEEEVDEFSVHGSGDEEDGSEDEGGETRRVRRLRRKGRGLRKRKRSESVDSDDDEGFDGYV